MKTRKELIDFRNQCLRKHREGLHLTFEETAAVIWDPNGKASKPMTSMAICKIEQKALAKLKAALAKYGIKSLDDMFENKHHDFSHINRDIQPA